MKKLLPALVLFSFACTTTPATVSPAASPTTTAATAAPPCNAGLALVDAAAWFQNSAEYRANALQVYATAEQKLASAISDPSWSALPNTPAGAPPAVILDLDETAIDNSRFEAQMVQKGLVYEPQSWSRWIASAEATTIPGAGEFLTYARSRGVKIFYITNRRGPEEAATRANLEKLGFPLESDEDTLLTRAERPEWNSDDKTARRDYVASRYRVIMLFGDDLNDFVRAVDRPAEERDRLVRDNAANWGSKWFILPNPMYGSWQRAITGNTSGCEQLQKMIDSLKP